MYKTCLFCKKPLGSNEVIEHFPVGRRLAFDAAKGRLWVVCRKCRRWNLTPLEPLRPEFAAWRYGDQMGERMRRQIAASAAGFPAGVATYQLLSPWGSLEMSLHEERERRALEGELWALEHAWKEAEEIASIADNLLLPAGTDEFFERFGRVARGREGGTEGDQPVR